MENRYLKSDEASKYLGIPIMELYRMTSSFEIPAYKFGGKFLYRKDQLEEILTQQQVNDLLEDWDLNKAA
jgi:excisionase family DNA binding protein